MTLPFGGAAYAVCDDYFGPLSQDNNKKIHIKKGGKC
jgi:hypothetical protein